MHHSTKIDSPVGKLLLGEKDGFIVSIDFLPEGHPDVLEANTTTPLLTEAKRQLEGYFKGTLITFSLPLRPEGTPFQQKCWDILKDIPYGTTISYGEEAERIGGRNYSRAVGMANGRNPIPIIIPCHRVIGSNGKLTGYAGGLDIKQRLLELEGVSHGG